MSVYKPLAIYFSKIHSIQLSNSGQGEKKRATRTYFNNKIQYPSKSAPGIFSKYL